MMGDDRPARRKLGPGIYLNGTTIHVYPDELCKHLGIPHTADSEKAIARAVGQVIREVFPKCDLELEEVYDE